MGSADRCDASGMARNRQPVVNRRTDPAPHQRRVAATFMAGNQQDDPVSLGNRPIQRPIDRFPRPVEAVTMQVEDAVGLHTPRCQPAIPAAVQGCALKGVGPWRS